MAGSAKRQRNCQIVVRCTEAEFAEIGDKADRAGVARGAFVRAASLGSPGPRAQRRPPADHLALRQLLGELGRIGNNINQIARTLNRDRAVEIVEIVEIRAALRVYVDLRDAIYEALGMPTANPKHDHQGREPR